jgi:hypothetical protein
MGYDRVYVIVINKSVFCCSHTIIHIGRMRAREVLTSNEVMKAKRKGDLSIVLRNTVQVQAQTLTYTPYTHPYERTHAYPIPMRTSEKVSRRMES